MSRTLHFVLFSESLNEPPHWRPTAPPVPDDGLHLTVEHVPDDVPERTVARWLDETAIALPISGAGRALRCDELGRGRFVNLYAGRRFDTAGHE
jgi:hypothetical protein